MSHECLIRSLLSISFHTPTCVYINIRIDYMYNYAKRIIVGTMQANVHHRDVLECRSPGFHAFTLWMNAFDYQNSNYKRMGKVGENLAYVYIQSRWHYAPRYIADSSQTRH